MLTLLLTARGDGCSDQLLQHFSGEVVRLDLDFLHLDRFRWCPDSIEFRGRSIPWTDVTAVYWRKPADPILHDMPQLEGFELRQRLHVFRSISAVARLSGIWQLVDPLHESKFPKPLQLRCAAARFAVPDWEIAIGPGPGIAAPFVSKALAPVPVHGERRMVTTVIPEGKELDPRFTWFLQSTIDAPVDVTVVYCRGTLWGFSLARPQDGAWIDWRIVMANHHETAWTAMEVPDSISREIRGFMEQLGLHYGRLDFLVDKQGKWWFLEVNPNGQFGWLDPTNARGIYSAIAQGAEGSKFALSSKSKAQDGAWFLGQSQT
jgi:hypothetical protein